MHICLLAHRCKDESDTGSTSADETWGGLGEFEYSLKGLPHAIRHVKELVMRGGHHDAFCTVVPEAGHKHFNKMAARFSRKYASLNQSQDGMLSWVNRQKVWSEVVRLSKIQHQAVATPSQDTASTATTFMTKKLTTPLSYTEGWHCHTYPMRQGRPCIWGTRLLSSKVRVTRHELLTLICQRLGIKKPERADIERVLTNLHLQCYGTLKTTDPDRTFVGISTTQPRRRDFVRLGGHAKDTLTTCLSVQVIMFVKVSGFVKNPSEGELELPEELRHPPSNYKNVVFTLIRWLSPHQDAILRDEQLRPICTTPFDINHALWKFSLLQSRRVSFNPTANAFASQLHMFDGKDTASRLECAENEAFAYYDLIEPESLSTYMNCTRVNLDQNDIMETITFPFHDTDTYNFV